MKEILLFGEIPVNCFILEENGECYIIDPGYEREKVVSYIESQGLKVIGILLTHGHIDHIGAIDAFDVPVYIHEDELVILDNNYNNGFTFYNKEKPYNLDDLSIIPIKDGHQFQLGNKVIDTIHVPGHTPGCICFKMDNHLYTGDTLFKDSVGRWDFPLGELIVHKKSIVNLVDSMDEAIIIHPAHGPESTIGREKKKNIYYLQWKKEQEMGLL